MSRPVAVWSVNMAGPVYLICTAQIGCCFRTGRETAQWRWTQWRAAATATGGEGLPSVARPCTTSRVSTYTLNGDRKRQPSIATGVAYLALGAGCRIGSGLHSN
jgi:hypothetical protein